MCSWLVVERIKDGHATTIGLRRSEEDEQRGLDLSQHAEAGYAFGELGSMGRIA
jgi:ammonia channel protein AmtB